MAGSGRREQGGRLSRSPHGAGSAPGGAFTANLLGLGGGFLQQGRFSPLQRRTRDLGEMLRPREDALNSGQWGAARAMPAPNPSLSGRARG